MNIRKVRESDRVRYMEMAKAFYTTDAVMENIPDEHFDDMFAELMRSDTYARCYIMEHEGEIVGYGLTARTFSQEAGGMAVFIEELYIEPVFRSMGFGQAFFQHLYMDEPTVKRFRLEVEDSNPRAIELYKRLGFHFLPYLQMYKKMR